MTRGATGRDAHAANHKTKGNDMTQNTVKMNRDKECKHSVRFTAPPVPAGQPQPAVDNVYVSRQTPGIETAKSVTVTIQVDQ